MSVVVLRFNLTNPQKERHFTHVYIFVHSSTKPSLISKQMMEQSDDLLFGLAGGTKVLFIFKPLFSAAFIGQNTPLASGAT